MQSVKMSVSMKSQKNTGGAQSKHRDGIGIVSTIGCLWLEFVSALEFVLACHPKNNNGH